jgi:hypothetical protein
VGLAGGDGEVDSLEDLGVLHVDVQVKDLEL